MELGTLLILALVLLCPLTMIWMMRRGQGARHDDAPGAPSKPGGARGPRSDTSGTMRPPARHTGNGDPGAARGE